MNLYGNQFNQMQRPQMYMQNNGITWVQGIEGAKAWQLSPNSNSTLLDSENDGIFYIKVSDNVGMCNLRIFKYEEITAQPKSPQLDMSEYVKKSELETLINNIFGGTNNEQLVSGNDGKSKSSK